jgi:endonuclease YncB( thermonuclease family)
VEVGQQNRRYCPSLSACDTHRQATGYNTPEENERGYEEAKRRLSNLILNKTVDIKNAKTIDDYGRLVADVYYNGKNLADYFSEYNI